MEKRLGVNRRQDYVNRTTTILNSGMIPPWNSDILNRFLLGKTRPGEELRTWKNKNWDIETMSHISNCEKT